MRSGAGGWASSRSSCPTAWPARARVPVIAFEGGDLVLVEPRTSPRFARRRRKPRLGRSPCRGRPMLERAGETRARARLALGRDEALVRRVSMPAATEENLRAGARLRDGSPHAVPGRAGVLRLPRASAATRPRARSAWSSPWRARARGRCHPAPARAGRERPGRRRAMMLATARPSTCCPRSSAASASAARTAHAAYGLVGRRRRRCSSWRSCCRSGRSARR